MSDKPLPPTDKRLRDARAEGSVARSEILAGLAATALATEVAFACVDIGAGHWFALTDAALAPSIAADRVGASRRLIGQAALLVAALSGVVASAAVVASVVAAWLGGGLSFAPQALKPSFKRLNAVRHVKGLLGAKHLLAVSIAMTTAGIVGSVAAWQLRDRLPAIGVMIDWQSVTLDRSMAIALLHTFARTLFVALIVPAALSAFIAKVQHRRGLRMSPRELKDEIKQTSGDPAMRAHQRASLHETMAVPPVRHERGRKALITNPEHVSVLLHYTGDACETPVVIGKALGEEALQMTHSALLDRVLVFRFRRLARHLYRHAMLQGPIPPDCYRAVAIVYRIVEELESLDERPNVPIEIDDVAFD